jgi:hypothetical protein
MDRKRIFNAFVYAAMSPVGFLTGWYAATGDYGVCIVFLSIEALMEFVAVYTYTDVISGEVSKKAKQETAVKPIPPTDKSVGILGVIL